MSNTPRYESVAVSLYPLTWASLSKLLMVACRTEDFIKVIEYLPKSFAHEENAVLFSLSNKTEIL